MDTRPITLIVADENGLRNPESVKEADKRLSSARPDKAFGLQIKRRRMTVDLSQEELAKLIGIHSVTLSRLETGSAPLTDKMRRRIETVFEALED